jgi:hypothetical protein
LVHDGTGDAHLRVPPLVRVARVPEPLLGNPQAAGECDLSVHDQDLPVRPLSNFVDRKETDRPILAPPDAGLLQPVLEVAELASPGVDQEADFDPPPRRLHHRLSELPARLVRLEDVGLQVDRFLRLPDRGCHRREDLVAVLQ